MRLVSPVILCPQSPVNIGEDRLIFIVYCAKYTAARDWSLLTLSMHVSNGGGLSIFSTNLTKTHGVFDIYQIELNDNLDTENSKRIDTKIDRFSIFPGCTFILWNLI
jgi:hypothetical protein